MAIYSTDILLFLVGTSLFYHVQFWLFLPDLHKDFSRGRSGGLVFPSLSEFSTVCCDSHNQWLWHSKKGRSRCFLELCCFFDDPPDVGNLISGSSDFSKSSLNIWKFMIHVLLKPGLENFEHYFTSVWDECNLWGSLSILWHCLSLGLEWKLTFSSPVATTEFSKFVGILVQHFHSIIF